MRHLATAFATLVSLAAFVPSAAAQEYATDRGSFTVGGSAGVSSYKTTGGWNTIASFNPQLQYFVTSGLGIGAALSVNRAWSDTNSQTSYTLGPSISYYFGRGERAIRPYVGAQGSFAKFQGVDGAMLGYGGSAGLLYMLTESVGLDTALFYRRLEPTAEFFVSSQENVGVSVGISAFVF